MSDASPDPDEPYWVTRAAQDARRARWLATAPWLTTRARGVIYNAGVETVEQLYAICPMLHQLPNCGQQTCQELYDLAGYVRPYRHPAKSLAAQERMAARLIELGWTCNPPPRPRKTP